MNNLYTIQNDEEYLEHHGILGQKWGRKNGPPYPIAPGDHSAAEKKAGWKQSIEKVDKVASTAGRFIKSTTTDAVLKDGYQHRENPKEKINREMKEQLNKTAPGKVLNKINEDLDNSKISEFPKSKTKEAYEKASKMSDKELDQAVNRLKKEKEFVDLQGKTITQGQNFVENMAIIAGTTLITTLVTKGSGKAAEAIVASVLAEIAGDKVFKAVYPKK